jgi:hypothetical protein
MDRGKTVYPPLPSGSGGIINAQEMCDHFHFTGRKADDFSRTTYFDKTILKHDYFTK